METAQPHLCEQCGESFSDRARFASHSCSRRLTASTGEAPQGNYKCSSCGEFFTKPGALKQHFRVHDGEQEPKGPFPCTEPGCRFSSTDRQEYQAHLTSTHSLTLVPCTVRSCKVSFCTRGEMEGHRRKHMPFRCLHCQFVSHNARQLHDHTLEHNSPLEPQGKQCPRREKVISDTSSQMNTHLSFH